MRHAVQNQTIATSAQLTGAYDLRNIVGGVTLHFPVLTSCQAFLLAAPADNTADYHRVHHITTETPGGGNETALLTIEVGAGSLALSLDQEIIGGFAFCKLETSVAQEGVRSLAMLCRITN